MEAKLRFNSKYELNSVKSAPWDQIYLIIGWQAPPVLGCCHQCHKPDHHGSCVANTNLETACEPVPSTQLSCARGNSLETTVLTYVTTWYNGLLYSMKRYGLAVSPCGTPCSILKVLVLNPSIITVH
jgi:hypothetical protein